MVRKSFENRGRWAEKFLNHLITENEAYHTHKEKMAHAGLLVMLALCGGIISVDQWPPKWIQELYQKTHSQYISFLSFFLLWFLLHVYIRWQLINRRIAAFIQMTAYKALSKWVCCYSYPRIDDLGYTKYKNNNQKQCCYCLINLLDYIIPTHCVNLQQIHQSYNLPKWLSDQVDEEIKNFDPIPGEWLVSLGSFVILIIVAFRSFPTIDLLITISGIILFLAIMIAVPLTNHYKGECFKKNS